MSKVTKKKLQADHNKLLNQFAELVRSLKSSKVISEETCPTFYRRTTEIVDDICEQAEPKLKQLDQSVFDGDPEQIRWAVVTSEGAALKFEREPVVMDGLWVWTHCNSCVQHSLIGTYNTTNWQNSLIERDKVELTGSDLCRAMLGNGLEYVMCLVGDECEESASNSEVVRVICSRGADYFDDTTEDMWYFAIPINNQGEPLTASEAGL